MPKEIYIIGGGIAGLSLGIALLREGIKVTLYEAGPYPRHRVCGEFICGVRAQTLNNLGVLHHLVDSEHCRSVKWTIREETVLERDLPQIAFGMSRYLLDFRMARQFRKLGGRLLENTRYLQEERLEGRVWAVGRRLEKESPWLGLKLHCENLVLEADLEMHLGKDAYIGLSRIEDGMVNVCGLFKKRPDVKARKDELLLQYLQSCGLQRIADRVRLGKPDVSSVIGVSGIEFSKAAPLLDRLSLGDQFAIIPPFTGNGMSMAFESAEIAVEPLLDYCNGKADWAETMKVVHNEQKTHFKRRLKTSAHLHPLLFSGTGQRLLKPFARRNWVPFEKLFALTHT